MENLREGELICPVCQGNGHLEQSMYVCEKCDGSGKVDWVSNVVTRYKKRTSLYRINVRRIVAHLQSLVKGVNFEPNNKTTMDTLKGMMKHTLSTLKDRIAIDDYDISQSFSDSGQRSFDISIKPIRSVEIIKLNFTIN